ncbi:nuclear speckle splicing regulatory protein 1-like isoform X2 [Neocloeon triangulifer]|uniref:nuclear speckle splicing regulatory protein 1-like isoform X2 n=1 Tax=Neocloeon triangulifer TaxID=2078957 RepID=UPI00286EF8E1|nr:nuclear speckle splicing regulatory protein 1-like isoform X2 [Neocloeon triangulifer]
MNILAATLVVLLAVSVSSLRQYPRRYADNYERYKNSDAVLEPPRPEEFEFYKSASEPKSSRDEKKESFDSEDEFGSFFKRPSESKRPSGKSQYHSEAKSIPAPKPIFDATEQVEHKEEKNTDPEEKIRCVKVDTKPVSADDVYRGRFRRAAVDKTMTCYKCEDLQKGGFYQKCSYGTDPGNKAFFVSHEKTSSSNEKPKHFKFDWDDVAQDGDREESKIEKEIRDSFFEPSSEYLAASSSVGKFAYDGPDFSSSNTNYRYEVPESSYEKARIPVNHPKSDYYQPSPSYLKALRQVPDGDKKAKKEEGEEKQPSEHRYSSYGEKESSKGKKASSEEEGSDEDGYSGHPSEQHNSKKEVASEEGDDDEEEEAEGSDEYAGKPTEYHFKSFKKQPSKSHSYHTTDPPVDLYYETKEASPSQQKKDYASSPNDYVYSSKKKQPTKLYSYESTDKPVVFAYKKETKTEPKSVHKPAYEFYSPTEFSFSKTVDDPLKTYYESSSYGGEDDKPAEGNAPKPQAVEAPKNQKEQQRRKNNAPQVREYSTTEEELPDTFVAQPSEELKKAMGDFLGKDRTNCTQVQRKQMTCWQCIDDSGTKQEECMYVASSQPAAHQTAYSDRKENKLQPKQAAAEPKKQEQSVDQKQVRSSGAEQRRRRRPSSGQRVSGTSLKETRVRRRRPDAVTSSTTEVVTVQAEGPPTTERRPRQRKPEQGEGKKANQEGRRRRPKKEEPTKAEAAELKERRVRKPAEEKKQDKKETTPAPEESKIADEEGQFSAETRVRYDKRLGMSLPDYMLERSDFEAEFDRAVRAG